MKKPNLVRTYTKVSKKRTRNIFPGNACKGHRRPNSKMI